MRFENGFAGGFRSRSGCADAADARMRRVLGCGGCVDAADARTRLMYGRVFCEKAEDFRRKRDCPRPAIQALKTWFAIYFAKRIYPEM